MSGYAEDLCFRVPEGDKQRIEQYAEDEGMSVSEAARRLIDRGLIVEMQITEEADVHAVD